jgi:hypothetical protein
VHPTVTSEDVAAYGLHTPREDHALGLHQEKGTPWFDALLIKEMTDDHEARMRSVWDVIRRHRRYVLSGRRTT